MSARRSQGPPLVDERQVAGLHEVLEAAVERGLVPGAVAAVAVGDDVQVVAGGAASYEPGAPPMRPDTLFRISSMTKPIVALATLVLVQEGRLALGDAVDGLLPELADRQVLVRPDAPLDRTVPSQRPITVEDVLTFRLGWGIAAADFPSWPLFVEAERLGLCLGPPLPRPTLGPDEWLRRIGTLPLLHQPGQVWRYDVGGSILGMLVARAAGGSLPEVLADRVLEPLGMHDTAWHVDAAQLERLATSYGPDGAGGLDVIDPTGPTSAWASVPAFPDGASALVSTVGDLVGFGRFLLGDGTTPDGRRLVSRSLLGSMTTDQLTGAQRDDPLAAPFLDGGGWGYGTGVHDGHHGWAGGLGTVWRNVVPVDGRPGQVQVVLTQRAVFPEPITLFDDVFAVLVESH